MQNQFPLTVKIAIIIPSCPSLLQSSFLPSSIERMSRETTALVLRKVSGPFTLETIKIDVLKPHEALIEIHAVGLCHTDLPCATGVLPAVTPAVFGHEGKPYSYSSINFFLAPISGAGAVVENGSRVDEASVSDKFFLSYAFCSNCKQMQI